jgi:hypothetical protein
MCDKCSLIDYPIGDPIWLPCGGPAERYTKRKPMTFTEDDSHIQQKIVDTVKVIQRQQQYESLHKGKGFEGLLE